MQPKKKILHLAEAFDGGVYFFLRDLVNRPELKDFEFEILHGIRREISSEQLSRDFPHAKLTFWPNAQREIRPFGDAKALLEAVKFIKRYRPDVIHCHSSKAGVLGRLAAYFTSNRKKILYSPHGLSFIKQDDPPWKRRFYAWIERSSARLGGVVVGCSASEVQALHEQKIKAVLVQNGVQLLEVGDADFASSVKIVTVGQIYVPKNPELFNEIATALPEIQFVWVGDGPLRHLLTAKNIQVTGWLSREQIPSFVRNAHIYLSTSLWEGLPLSVLEAMAMRRAVLLSPCVGNVDLVNGKNGFLFYDKQDAIQRITGMVSDQSALRRMGDESLRIVKDHFSIAKMAEKYADLYSSLLQNRFDSHPIPIDR